MSSKNASLKNNSHQVSKSDGWSILNSVGVMLTAVATVAIAFIAYLSLRGDVESVPSNKSAVNQVEVVYNEQAVTADGNAMDSDAEDIEAYETEPIAAKEPDIDAYSDYTKKCVLDERVVNSTGGFEFTELPGCPTKGDVEIRSILEFTELPTRQ